MAAAKKGCNVEDYEIAFAEFQNLPELEDGAQVELALLLLEDVETINPDQTQRLFDVTEKVGPEQSIKDATSERSKLAAEAELRDDASIDDGPKPKSPTPWFLMQGTNKGRIAYKAGHGPFLIAEGFDPDDAATIVHRVNGWENLKAGLREARRFPPCARLESGVCRYAGQHR